MYYTKQSKMLESKVVVYAMFYVLGIPATILGILENYGTWKSDLLFFLSAILIVLKIYYYYVERNQLKQKRNMDLEKQRFYLDQEKQKNKIDY